MVTELDLDVPNTKHCCQLLGIDRRNFVIVHILYNYGLAFYTQENIDIYTDCVTIK